jgi:hypothetical protein
MKFSRKKSKQPQGRNRLRSSGQTVPGAFSYYGQGRQHDTVRQKLEREPGRATAPPRPNLAKLLTERIGLLILIIAVVAGVINSLSLSASVHVVLLGDSKLFLHDTSTYEAASGNILGDSIWNRNKLTINTDGVASHLRQHFPELSQVSITLPLIAHRPIVYLQASQPVLILNTTSGGYVIGQNGVALLPTTQLEPGSTLKLPVATDQAGLKLKTGQQALASGDVAFIQMILAQLKAANIEIAGLSLPPAASELDVHLAGLPYFVKFNMHDSADDARQQAGTFLAVQQHLKSQNITPGQYIDVRVDGRAYYQ